MKISQNLQENNYARVSFLIKFQVFFTEHLWTTASVFDRKSILLFCRAHFSGCFWLVKRLNLLSKHNISFASNGDWKKPFASELRQSRDSHSLNGDPHNVVYLFFCNIWTAEISYSKKDFTLSPLNKTFTYSAPHKNYLHPQNRIERNYLNKKCYLLKKHEEAFLKQPFHHC